MPYYRHTTCGRRMGLAEKMVKEVITCVDCGKVLKGRAEICISVGDMQYRCPFHAFVFDKLNKNKQVGRVK